MHLRKAFNLIGDTMVLVLLFHTDWFDSFTSDKNEHEMYGKNMRQCDDISVVRC